MFNKLKGKDRKISRESVCYQMPVIFCLALVVLLLILPTGFEDAVIYKGTERCAAEVVAVNDSKIISTGLIKSGEQTCTVKFFYLSLLTY